MNEKKLIEMAIEARERSYSPYSGFRVGAALYSRSGNIYTGCNVENAAFSPGICAERTAFAKAVSDGERQFQAIAIVGGSAEGKLERTAPCGVCRQVMMEFCDPESFRIILAKSPEDYEVYTLEELLPMGFGPGNLKG